MARKKADDANNTGFSSQSSDKLLLILEHLAAQGAPVRLQDISAQLVIPQPTVLRYLNTLVKQGYAYKDRQTLRYSLTWRVCRLGHQVMSHSGLRDIAAPYLRELANTYGGGTCLVVRQDDELLYLDVVDNPVYGLSSLQRIGKSAPMHTTASGKVLLAGLTDGQVERIMARKGMDSLTRNTITELPALLAQLQRIRADGCAMDDEECEEGIRCVSAPIYDYTDRLVAAISVFGAVEGLHNQFLRDRLVPALRDAARQISMRLGSLA